MAYRYVAARYNYGPRKATRAIVFHFTEGNGGEGDVTYLAGSPDRGVSANFVIKSDGEIVRMLPWANAAGSINPRDIRTTNDAAFTSPDGVKVRFGVTAAKAALGDLWGDPNAAVIAVEIGGKAANGPTSAQTKAIVALTEHARARYGAKLPALGHRDFQDYKPCPGKLIHWGTIGGHGTPSATEGEIVGLGVRHLATVDKPWGSFVTAKIKGSGHSIIRVRDKHYVAVADGLDLGTCELTTLTAPLDSHDGNRTDTVSFNSGTPSEEYVALRMDCDITPLAAPDPKHDVSVTVDGNSVYQGKI